MDEVTNDAPTPPPPAAVHGHSTLSAVRATVRDVARAAGVSHTTVSNAFARPDQLSSPLRAHVLATARALGYAGPSPAARSLRTGRHGALGLVFSEDLPYAFSDPTATQFLQGVAEACRERAANLLLIATRTGGETGERGGEGGDDVTLAGSPALRDAAVDGMIVYSLASDSPMLAPIAARGLPLVVVDQPRLAGVAFVGIDDLGAARMAAEHLLALGHRRFLIVSLKLCPDGREGLADAARTAAATYEVAALRLAGYRAALAAAGLDAATAPVVECARNDERRARDLIAPLLATVRPTAVLAMSDRLALGAVAAAHGAGLAVPGDVSVVGFDDVAVDGTADALPLTTVHQPHAGKGRAAVEQLGAAAAGGACVLTTELVVRASTGPAPDGAR